MVIPIILAAGEGKRMKSKYPKVLHQICGKPMLEYVLDTLEKVGFEKKIIVISPNSIIANKGYPNVEFAIQEKQIGTGNAVLSAKELLKGKETILILYGDVPLITVNTIQKLIETHRKTNADATILTAIFKNPTGYGRIIRDIEGRVKKIVEERDANVYEKAIEEINTGIYCFEWDKLESVLEKIKPNNDQKEYYLTDAIELFTKEKYKVETELLSDITESMSINNRKQLVEVSNIVRKKIMNNLMENGVTIVDPMNTYIESEVEIGKDTIIYPFTFIQGNTKIGEDCIIGPSVQLKDVNIENNVEIKYAVITNSIIKENARIGPYTHIRPESIIGKDAKIGNFVEIKKSKVGERNKISHLSYIGDTDMEEDINVGAGTITCNYDGVKKHKTIIEKNVFIGSNVNLIAPVKIGEGAIIGAGSTITDDVPAYALGIARQRQQHIEEYAKRKKKLKDSNE